MMTEPATTRPRLRPFRTPVRGHAFAAVPADELERTADLRVTLAREPGNPADPLAVAIWIEGERGASWRIGYLDRGVAARIGPRLDEGSTIEARLEGWTPEPEGRWQRPVVVVLPAEDIADRSAGLWGRPPGVTRRVVRSGRVPRAADQARSTSH